jgi:hypothetical protein
MDFSKIIDYGFAGIALSMLFYLVVAQQKVINNLSEKIHYMSDKLHEALSGLSKAISHCPKNTTSE